MGETNEIQEFQRRKIDFDAYLRSDEYQSKLHERLVILDASERDLEARTIAYNLCQRPDNPVEGCKFFINTFGFTFDPRPEHSPHHLPFITFPYQDRAIQWFIDHIDGSQDGLIEKSRDMGMSWIFVWVALWYFLFRDGVNILVGSYKEALVDDRTDDSLFGKMDYSLRTLPNWILPKGFRFDKHRTKLKLVNPATGNFITGDTMNPNFGRGSRKTAIFFDEIGSWDYAKEAWESSGDSTSCRIGNSTPKGYNFMAMLKEQGIDTLTLHWKEHPLKDDEWYAFECARRTEEEVAQELDISYNKSKEGRVYPEWNDVNVIEGNFDYNPHQPLYVSWDFGQTDDTAIVWAQIDKGGDLVILDAYKNSGKIIDFYIPFITGVVPSDIYKYTKEDLEVIQQHASWSRGTHFGDPAGRFTNQVTNTSVIEVLKMNNIIVNFRDDWKDFSTRKTAGKKRIMNGIKLNKNARTKYFSMCMLNSAYPKVKHEGVEQVRSQKPKHDNFSHFRSSFEYLCLGLKDMAGPVSGKTYDKFKKREGRNKRVIGY